MQVFSTALQHVSITSVLTLNSRLSMQISSAYLPSVTQKYITEPPRISVGYKSLTLYSRSANSLLRMLDIGLLQLLSLTLRRLMSYIYEAPILDVSRSHTTTQHSR